MGAAATPVLQDRDLTPRERHDFIRAVMVATRRWRLRLDERLEPLGMSSARSNALYWLGQADNGISQATLSEMVGVSPPSLVRVIDQLEAQGLVERRLNPTDRRENLLHLTPAAKPVLAEIEAEADWLGSQVFGFMSPAECRVALTELRQMGDLLGLLGGGPTS